MGVWNKIKQAFLSKVLNDSSSYAKTQATYNGKAQDIVRHSPYGLCSNPPTGSLILMISTQDQESISYGIIDDHINRFKDLKEGEVIIGNYITKSYVKFDTDGNIEVDSKGNLSATVAGTTELTSGGNATITAPETEINSDVTINGDLVVNGNLTCSGDGITSGNISGINVSSDTIDLDTHVHGGVTRGIETTDGPQ